MLTDPELATVLAALRHWQATLEEQGEEWALSWPQFVDHVPLTPSQISSLCDRLNDDEPATSEPSDAGGRYVLYDFDAKELVTTVVYDSLESAKQDADHLNNITILKLPIPGEDRRPCECEEPGGYFYSGVPGILAHMGAGGVATGSKVERCDQCQRYPSDEAALARMRELGLA